MYCLDITDRCEIYPQRDEYHRLYNVEVELCSELLSFLKEHNIEYDVDFDYRRDDDYWITLRVKDQHLTVLIKMCFPELEYLE